MHECIFDRMHLGLCMYAAFHYLLHKYISLGQKSTCRPNKKTALDNMFFIFVIDICAFRGSDDK